MAEAWTARIGTGGPLRIGLFPSFMYVRETGTGLLRGIAVELAQPLAADLGMTARLIEYPAPPQVVAALRDGACDVAFLGVDPVRGKDVDFSPPLMRSEFTFLVPPGSAVGAITDADRPGVRIAVVHGHAMETALAGQVERATRVFAATPDAAFELMQGGGADVLAGIRPGLMAYARRYPGSALLPDRYGANTLALAVAKGDAEGLARISAFVAAAKVSGLAQRAIAAAGLEGIDVVDA
jgi:polar amino acid transport system substrate-binding protein